MAIRMEEEIREILSSHEGRITKHDIDTVRREKDIEALANKVNGILSIIKWTASTLFTLLAGFFIWYVQSLGLGH